MQEQVSSREAVLRAGMPYRSAIDLEIEPTVMIATVLLAVHMLTRLTMAAMHHCAPRRPLTSRVIALRRNWMPPMALMSPSMPAARRVMMMSWPIESEPSPMSLQVSRREMFVQMRAIAIALTMPQMSTRSTFMPMSAVTIITK